MDRSNTAARRRERTSHPLSTKFVTNAPTRSSRVFVNTILSTRITLLDDEHHAVAPQSSTPTHASQSVRLFAIAWTHVVVMERHGAEVAHPKSVALQAVEKMGCRSSAGQHAVIPTDCACTHIVALAVGGCAVRAQLLAQRSGRQRLRRCHGQKASEDDGCKRHVGAGASECERSARCDRRTHSRYGSRFVNTLNTLQLCVRTLQLLVVLFAAAPVSSRLMWGILKKKSRESVANLCQVQPATTYSANKRYCSLW